MERVPLIDGPAIRADTVAVSPSLFALERAIVALLASRFQIAVATPEQLLVAVVWCLMVDHCGTGVCASRHQATAAWLAGVSVP